MINSKMRSGRRFLSGGLAVLLLCGPAGGLLTTPVLAADSVTYTNGASVPSVLVFPFANNAGATAGLVGSQLDDAVKLRLNAIGAYTIVSYTKFLPPVQRAVTDSVLSQDELGKAGSDPATSGKIAVQVATSDYLTGAVETFTADPTTRRVKLEVSADLRSTQTGVSLRTIAFTGEAGPTSSSETLEGVTQQAVNIVAGKIVSSINSGLPVHTPLAASQRGHSSSGQKFLIGVLASSLLIAILSNSHSGGGNNNNNNGTTPTGGTGGGTTISGPPAPPTTP